MKVIAKMQRADFSIDFTTVDTKFSGRARVQGPRGDIRFFSKTGRRARVGARDFKRVTPTATGSA